MTQDYNAEIQKLFIEMMVQDASLFVRVQNIFNPANFDRSLRQVAEFVVKHSNDYKVLPSRDQIRAVTGVELLEIPDIQDGHNEWFLKEFESFTKKQELERAILKAADMIEKGDFNPVEKLIKDAVHISLLKDMGTDYFSDPKTRLDRYFSSGGQVSTGWPQLDRILFGGMSRGELNVFAGGSGSGKSLVMMNIALSWLQAGLSGIYITLELSEELVGLRTDAMLTSTSTKDIRKDIDDTTLKVRMVSKKSGTYQIKSLPAQSNINDIRAYVKEYQIQTGRKIDFMMVDYLDLLMPVSAKVNPSDLFTKDKYVSEELRNFARELNILLVTASQLNRSAVEEIEFDHSHISGGISKINTADNVFGIFTSRQMRERGKYQIQCMKSRSSTGVGQKIDLEYDIETMRISDSGESASNTPFRSTGTQIIDQFKTKSTVAPSSSGGGSSAVPFIKAMPKKTADEPMAKVNGTVDNSKLKQLLAGLKSNQND